jgi:flagellar biosynthetic protein FliO
MRFQTALDPEVGRASGPDLTRYLIVCAATIAALLVLAWLFRRFVAGHLRARAAKRSLRVLDVLPLSGRQRLVVVRCYDRSFLLGLGDREVRAIAELDAPELAAEAAPSATGKVGAFGGELERELALQPAKPPPAPAPSLGSKEGLLA